MNDVMTSQATYVCLYYAYCSSHLKSSVG